MKQALSNFFAMKDLGLAKQILGMRIICDKKEKNLWLSQKKYIEKLLQRLNVDKAKVVSTPLTTHFRLSKKQSLLIEKEKEDMQRVPSASAIGSRDGNCNQNRGEPNRNRTSQRG